MSGNSFEKIDYRLRPAKAVERKMISFAMQKLNSFCELSKYQYIGFGSTSFQDHILFHRDLGITKLISIEKSGKKERFNFNKPFHCIEIEFGQSTDILPNVNWKDRTILWLDYDGKINSNCLSDVRTFFTSALSGSVFILTINADAKAYGENNEIREENIGSLIGENRLPIPNKPINYSAVNLHSTLKRVFDTEINSAISIRNGGLNDKDKISYKPLFNFKYADGANMLTIGGLLINNSDLAQYNKANFNELSFVKTNNDIFKISIPSLTLKEIRFLNSQLPTGIDDEGIFVDAVLESNDPCLSKEDIIKYSKIYNYFPVFTESLVF